MERRCESSVWHSRVARPPSAVRAVRRTGYETVDFLVWLLFESTLLLGGCLGVMLFVLLVHWRRTLQPRPLLIGLALAVVLLIAQAAVVTRKEHADRIMERIETAVLASQPEVIAGTLSTRFRIEKPEMDGEQFTDLVRAYMQWVNVRSLSRTALTIEESRDDTFRASLSYLGEVTARDFTGLVQSRWNITFVRDQDGWHILSIEPTMLQRQTIKGWGDLR